MVSNSLGLVHCGMNFCSHKSSLLRRQSLNPVQQGFPFFSFVFIFVYGSVTFISPLSHYWISGLPKHLAHWRWQSGPAKRTLSPFTKPWIFWEVKDAAQGHKKNQVLKNRSSKFKSRIQNLKKQGVRLASCHWIIGRLPLGSQNKIPHRMQRQAKQSSIRPNKAGYLG